MIVHHIRNENFTKIDENRSTTSKLSFCPIHECLLKPVRDSNKLTGETGQLIKLAKKLRKYKCPFCDFTQVVAPDFKPSPQVIEKKIMKNKTHINSENSDYEIRPSVEVLCPLCSHVGAYFQMIFTGEVETVYYECKKCQHKWREDDR